MRCPAHTTNLSATPERPACPSRASGWSSLTTLWGFPCCVRLPCVRAAATTPVQRLGVVFARLTQPYQPSTKPLSARPAHPPFRGLLRRSPRLRPAHLRRPLRDGYPRASDISLPPCLPRLLPAGAVGRAGLAPAGNAPPFTAHGETGRSNAPEIRAGASNCRYRSDDFREQRA